MNNIVFFDAEIQPGSGKVLDLGAVKRDGSRVHTPSKNIFSEFVSDCPYVCGHNILAHDLRYMDELILAGQPSYIPIDTLCLSPLLFPSRPYHALLKDDKLQSGQLNKMCIRDRDESDCFPPR